MKSKNFYPVLQGIRQQPATDMTTLGMFTDFVMMFLASEHGYLEISVRTMSERWDVSESKAYQAIQEWLRLGTVRKIGEGSRGVGRFEVNWDWRAPANMLHEWERALEGSPPEEMEISEEQEKILATESSPYSKAFETAWSAYPRKLPHSKAEAWDQWKRWLKIGVKELFLLKQVTAYGEYLQILDTEQKYMPHLRTFLSQKKRMVVDVNWDKAVEAARAEKDGGKKEESQLGFDPSQVE